MSTESDLSGFDPNNPHLTGVLIKLLRARNLKAELDRLLDHWLDSEPWAAPTEFDERGQPRRIFLELRAPIPAQAGAIIGDIVHNLRSSLDHLAVAAAKRAGRSERDVAFPVANSYDSFPDKLKKELRKCPDSFKNFVTELKPYKGGNDVLYDVHLLDRIDKHHILLPVGQASTLSIHADRGYFGAINFSRSDTPVRVPLGSNLDHGDTILNYSAFSDMGEKTTVHTEVAISITLEAGPTGKGRLLEMFLCTALAEVERVVMLAETSQFR